MARRAHDGDGEGRTLGVLIAIYAAAVVIGLSLVPPSTGVAAFWPAAGVLAGGLTLLAPKQRKWLLAAVIGMTVATTLWSGGGVVRAAAFSTANVLNGLIFLALFRIGGEMRLRAPVDMLRFVLAAAAAGAGSAIAGSTGLAAWSGSIPTGHDWVYWFLADFTGVIAVAAPIIAIRDPAPVRRMTLEIAAVVASGTVVTAIAYSPWFGPNWPQITPLAFATPFVIWCAVRGSVFANALLSVALSLIAILVVTPAIGAEFGRSVPTSDLILATQLFILRVCGASLLLSILFEDRRRSELQLRTIIDTVPVGLILAEARTGRVIEVNEQVEKLLRHAVPLAGETTERSALLPWASLIESAEQTAPLDVHYRRGDGSQAWLRLLGRPVKGSDGDVIGSVVAIVDVDEERKAWDRIQAEVDTLQSRLIHSSRVSAMGTMASAIAHELNQPLAAIGNYLSGAGRLVRSNAAPDPDTQALVGIAIDRAESCAGRAGDILMRLRQMMNRESAGLEPATVNDLIEVSMQMALMGTPAAGVRWRQRSLPGVQVKVDPIQIQQVLINLITNAVEAVAGQSAPVIEIAAARTGDRVRIDVIDDGPGFAPEILASLFEPFHSSKKTGLGVGLSICRTIVERHDGRIEVARDGDRTRVSVTLPLYEAKAEVLAKAA